MSTLKFCVALLFFGVIARLFYWQLVVSDTLQAKAESQRVQSAKMPGQRGTILFSDGSVLATSKLSFLVFAEKKFIDQPAEFAKILSPVVNEHEATLAAKLSQDLSWIPLIPRISAETKQNVENLKLKGIGFDRHEQRYYPEASMAAQLLGFVGKDNAGKDHGYFGLEGYYNSTLQGKEGFIQQEKDVAGRPILTAQAQEAAPLQGSTLQLYIDRTIQYIAEQKLKEGVEKFEAVSGDLVIMDPNTGGILAMAAYPEYNPAEYFSADPKVYKNPIVSDTYEPGSTFKSLIMAAAINEGVIKPDTTCPCTEFKNVGGFTIRNWDNKMHPNTTMNDVLKNSDNNGMMFVGEKLGKNRLLEYIEKFGIGSATNIDLQNEEVPRLRKKDAWYEVDYATATFGQGISATPIQIVRAVAAIANGGKLMEPHVVQKIITPEKTVDIKPKVVSQVLDKETTKTMTQMLVYTVDQGEAGRLYKPKGFSVAAKSGTAQISMGGRYAQGQVVSSYVGFAPADNPRYVMLVRINQPKNAEHGATTAGPIFYAVSKALFEYWGLSPDPNNTVGTER